MRDIPVIQCPNGRTHSTNRKELFRNLANIQTARQDLTPKHHGAGGVFCYAEASLYWETESFF